MLKVGILKEIKPYEGRVALTPEGVKVLVMNGIEVVVEHEAGNKCKFDNVQYQKAGADILPTTEKVLQAAQCIVKVQPPQPIEYELINPSHIVVSFSNFLHNPDRIKALLSTNGTFISTELIQDEQGNYPILMGMSDIAGRMAIYQAAKLLTISEGGKGKLISGLDQVKPAVVTIVGAGKVGRTAAHTALANGAHVNMVTLKPEKVGALKKEFPTVKIEVYSEETLRELLPHTDVLLVAVYSLKSEYDILIKKEMVALMEEGSVLIDISVEQANVVETSHITSHDKPTFILDGIVHYCVPNIAAVVPLTASRILTKKLLPFIKATAGHGLKKALDMEPGLVSALSIYKGKVTNRIYADTHGHEFYNIFELLELNL